MSQSRRSALLMTFLTLLFCGAGLLTLFQLVKFECFASVEARFAVLAGAIAGFGLFGFITAIRRLTNTSSRSPLSTDLHQKVQTLKHLLSETNQQLQNSEDRFRFVLEKMPVLFVAFDATDNISAWNQECERVTGYSAAEVIGNAGIMAQLYPNAQYLQQQIAQWRERGDDYRNWEWDLTCKDGSVRTIAWFNIAAKFPVPGWATWGIGVDVTERKRTEQALAQANERFRLAMSAINAIVYEWDLEQDKVERSEGTCNLFGFPSEAITAPSNWWLSRIHPEDIDIITQQFLKALQQKERYSLEYRVRNQEGQYVDVYDQGLIVRNATGKAVRIVGSTTDITGRKRAEAALQHSEATARAKAAELEAFMEAVPIGVWVAHDPECHHVTPNQAAYEMMRRSHGSVMTATPADGEYPFQFKIQQNGQDVASENLPMQQAGRAGQSVSGEFEFVFEDGDICFLYGKAVPVRYESGEIRGVIGAFVDITDRKQTEAALRESESKFRTLADTMPQLFWVVDQNSHHDYCNPRLCDYSGLTLEQMHGDGWQQMVHPDDLPNTIQAFTAACRTGEMFTAELRLRRASDGDYRWHLAQALPFYNQSGEFVKWFGSSTDIHDQKLAIEERAQALERERAARMELERASRMKDEFLAVVSHELRSPLNAILGWSRLLRTRTFNPEKTEQALASIERNAQAQTQLIEDLLDISRIIRGKVRLDLRPTHLIPCVQAAIDTIRPAVTAKSIALSFHSLPDADLVSGDPERLQQIVWNLLSNAVKFTPTHGRIEVCVQAIHSVAQIQVTDSGKGISSDFLPYIFERFRQEDATTTRTQGGLGLGLAIVRNLVELHGGTIHVDSPGEGQGTTFIVHLPLISSALPNQPANYQGLHRQTTVDTVLDLSNIQVLIVDDERDTREFLQVALEQYGAKVMSAASAAEAWTFLQTYQPDILLSDVGMPDEDGFTLIRRIRSLPPSQGGQIPAAALTAYAREGDRLEALSAGFHMHIPKPIEPIQLLTVIVKLLETQKELSS